MPNTRLARGADGEPIPVMVPTLNSGIVPLNFMRVYETGCVVQVEQGDGNPAVRAVVVNDQRWHNDATSHETGSDPIAVSVMGTLEVANTIQVPRCSVHYSPDQTAHRVALNELGQPRSYAQGGQEFTPMFVFSPGSRVTVDPQGWSGSISYRYGTVHYDEQWNNGSETTHDFVAVLLDGAITSENFYRWRLAPVDQNEVFAATLAEEHAVMDAATTDEVEEVVPPTVDEMLCDMFPSVVPSESFGGQPFLSDLGYFGALHPLPVWVHRDSQVYEGMLYVGNTPGTMSVGHYPENLAVDLSYGRVRAPLTSLRVRRDGPWEPIEEVPTEVCYNCGHHYRTPDEHTVGDDDLIRAYTLQGRYSDTWICESCSSNIYTCDDCGEPMLADDSHTTPNGDTLCEDCFDREWTNCCGCGEPTRNGDIRRDEDGDAMCPSCYRQASVICSYHSSGAKNASKFGESPEAGKAWYGMGIELEMSHKDCADEDDLEEIAKSVGGMLPDGLVFFERDGSVDYGFEMITAPMTFGYFRDNLSMFSDVLRYCSSEGMVSHNSDSSCGIHIHLSKTAFGEFESEQEYTTTKMVLLYERFYNDLKTLSRRNSHQLNSYAERYGTENLGSIDSNVKSKGGSRFRAVNLRNDNTIEVRMWRGTLNPKTFAATVELTIALLETAKRKNVRTIQKARSLRSCIGKQYLAAHPVLDEYMASKGL